MNYIKKFANEIDIRYYMSGEKEYKKNDSFSVAKLPFDVFMACQKGEFNITMNGSDLLIKSGEVCIIPFDTSYNISASENTKISFVSASIFAYTNLRLLSLFEYPSHISGENGCEMANIIDDIVRFESESTFTTMQIEYSVKIHDRVSRLFSILFEYSISKDDVFGQIESYEKFSDVFELISEHINESMLLQVLSDKVNMTPDVFYRAFKQLTKQAPKEFIISEKLKIARELLVMSDMSIHDISVFVGYPDQLYFSSLFRKKYKTCPTEYRKETSRII